MHLKKISLFLLSVTLSACGIFTALTSNTSIGPNNSFVLGNNKHGSFSASVTNVSTQELDVAFQPLDGEVSFVQILLPKECVTLKVKANTSLIISNKSNKTANVDLKIKGDAGLSMGYSK